MKKDIRLFVMMYQDVLDTPAWRQMSHGARNLYVALKRGHNAKQNNNGRIFLSVRNASLMIGAHKDLVAHWFREMQHFGFAVMTRQGSLGTDGKGRAPHFRLTELNTCQFSERMRKLEPWPGSTFLRSQAAS
jgi:hypothetical protein